jgi:hypothetical protein
MVFVLYAPPTAVAVMVTAPFLTGVKTPSFDMVATVSSSTDHLMVLSVV